MRPAAALVALASAFASPAPAQTLDPVYRDGSMPAIAWASDFELSAFQPQTCLEYWKGEFGSGNPPVNGEGYIGRFHVALYYPQADEKEHALSRLVICHEPSHSSIDIAATYLRGERYPDFTYRVVPIANGQNGRSECKAKAEQLANRTRLALAPLLPDQEPLYSSVVLQDRARKIAFVVNCTEYGWAALAAAGSGSALQTELGKLLTDWNRR